MSASQLKARRPTRTQAGLERGEMIIDMEQVGLKSCNEGLACGSFLYMGSLMDNKGSCGPEIRKRIKNAPKTFRKLRQVWAMKGLPLKLKGGLFSVFVHSLHSSNREV